MGLGRIEHVVKVLLRAQISLYRPVLQRAIFEPVCLLCDQISVSGILDVLGTISQITKSKCYIELVTLCGVLLYGFSVGLAPVFVRKAARCDFASLECQVSNVVWLVARLQSFEVHAKLVAPLHIKQNKVQQKPESE